MEDWISLNVGGTVFQTSRLTLTAAPESILAKMFDSSSPLPPAKFKDGCYLLDADPKAFAVILDWLRYKRVVLTADVTVDALLAPAAYFGLQELESSLLATSASDRVTLNVGGQTMETSLATLRSQPGSVLHDVFDPHNKDNKVLSNDPKTSAVFLDADPKTFAVILNWLRYNTVMLTGDVTLENLLAPAKRFGLQRLLEDVHRLLKDKCEEEVALLETKFAFRDDLKEYLSDIAGSLRNASTGLQRLQTLNAHFNDMMKSCE